LLGQRRAAPDPGQLDPGPGRSRVVREEQDGLRCVLDLEKVDRTAAVQALEAILARLRG
jgi:hypothetical protein